MKKLRYVLQPVIFITLLLLVSAALEMAAAKGVL
jgi:hypothetical protein